MHITSNTDGAPKTMSDPDYFTYQHLIDVKIGISEEIKLVFESYSRDNTSVEIFDGKGNSMGGLNLRYATGRMNTPLVSDINVLLEEHGVQINPADFDHVTARAIQVCESRYGRGVEGGDVIVTIN